MEERLWRICEKLRGGVEVQNYKYVVLPLIFLKFLSLKFETTEKDFLNMKHGGYEEKPEFFIENDTVYLPEDARWNYLISTIDSKNFPAKLDRAFRVIAEENPNLSDVFEENFYRNLKIEKTNLRKLVLEIDKLKNTSDEDIFGKIYEYFLEKFAILESRGRKEGEFYTPKSIINFLETEFGPFSGKLYDPCLGTGAMFTQLEKKNAEFYGQEIKPFSYRLAKMNFLISNLSCEIKLGDTLKNDQFKDLKADFIFANPPYNIRGWKSGIDLNSDERFKNFKTELSSANANYAWILHCLSKMKEQGTAFILLPNSALIDEKTQTIRQWLAEEHLIYGVIELPIDLFYRTKTAISILVLKRNSKHIIFRDIREGNLKKSETHLNENFSFLPSDYIDFKPQKIDFQKIENRLDFTILELSKKIKALETVKTEVKTIKNRSKTVKLQEIIEKIENVSEIKTGEFAVNLMHVGRDGKLPILHTNREKMPVPKSYFCFKIRKNYKNLVSDDYLIFILSSEEIAKSLKFLSGSGTRGEVKPEKFLELEIPIKN